MKPVEFLGDSLDRVRAFPDEPRREAGFQIDRLQRGFEPNDWKPMATVGVGVREIRMRDPSGQFRVVYLATLPDAVYVLNAFKKASPRTPKAEVRLAKQRYAELIRSKRGKK